MVSEGKAAVGLLPHGILKIHKQNKMKMLLVNIETTQLELEFWAKEEHLKAGVHVFGERILGAGTHLK